MFVVEKDNKIIMADTDHDRLKSTLSFMPDCADCEIVETDREITEIDGMYIYADSAEYKSKQVQERIAVLKELLAGTDYVVLKIAEGVATKEDYASVLDIRQQWRAEINELETIK